MSTQNTITLAYVVKGFFASIDKVMLSMTPQSKNGGEISVVQHLAELAQHDDAVYKEHGNPAGLTWAYEVSEMYGEWIAQYVNGNGAFPPDDACTAKLMALAQIPVATVVIEVRGGNVQCVYTGKDAPPIRVVVRDFDNIEKGDPDPINDVPGDLAYEPNTIYLW